MTPRRSLLQALSLGLLAPFLPGRARSAATRPTVAPTAADAASPGYRTPAFELVYECEVTLQGVLDFGKTTEGTRRVIPITGGHFRGPRLSGTVVPGGADWNLTRADGSHKVEAEYYLRTDDGTMIRIVNRGAGPGGDGPPPVVAGERFYMFTTPEFEAPEGRHDWLNRATFVGTLGGREGLKDAVLIRVFQVT